MTVVVIVIAVVAVAVVAGVLVMLRRRPTRSDDRVASFRRHIDALSPEARREVIDRVRDNKDGEH